jgi:N-acetylmuramoyl-L-alanine amidase
MKIYVSPSMQEKNGNPRTGYVEETQMNLVADILIPELERHGLTIMRNKTSASGVEEICTESNAWGADYHVAIHSNAFNGTIRGCEVYCYNPSDTSRKGTQLAYKMYERVRSIMPVEGRGVRSGATTMSEIAHTNAPSALIEIDYHDTDAGSLWIMANIAPVAEQLLYAILDQVGITFIPKVSPLELKVKQLECDLTRCNSINLSLSNQVDLKTEEIIKLSGQIKELNYNLTVTEQKLADTLTEVSNYKRILKGVDLEFVQSSISEFAHEVGKKIYKNLYG